MLTRLLVLAAVIAAFFVFVPTSSAQVPNLGDLLGGGLPAEEDLPTECLDIQNTTQLVTCLLALDGGDDGNDDDNVDVCPEGTVATRDSQQASDDSENVTQEQALDAVPNDARDQVDAEIAQTQGPVSLLDLLGEDGDLGDLLGLLGLLELLFGDDDEEQQDNVVCEERQTGDNTEAGEGDLGFVEEFDPGGDDGFFPEGGIESGYGPTRSDEAGVPLAAPGAALLALVGVLTTGLVVRRRRSGS